MGRGSERGSNTLYLKHVARALILFATANANAAGFEIPDHGANAIGRAGAVVATVNDGTAVVYNPAMLAFQDGTRLTFSNNLAFHMSDFTRAGIDPNTSAAFPRVSNQNVGFWVPFIAVSSQLGLKNWTFALAVHGPNSYGRLRFPESGPQRYSVIDTDFVVIHYSAAAAWRPHSRLALGLTAEWVDSRIRLKQKLPLVAGTEIPANDVTTTVEIADHFSPTVILGVRWEFADRFVFGFSMRPPIFVKAEGTVKSVAPDGLGFSQSGDSARSSFSQPVVARAGIAWLASSRFNVEADVVFEGWSVLQSFKASFPGVSFSIFGATLPPVADVVIPKEWRDTWSVRLGGNVVVVPRRLTLRAGAIYETAAVPTKTTALDFTSFDRFVATVGASVEWKGVELALAYSHIFQNDRTVTDSIVTQAAPVGGVPTTIGNGLYKANYDTFSASLTVHFDPLFK